MSETASEPLQIKGSTLLSKLEFLRERFGEDAAKNAAAHLAAQGVRQPLSGSWYPFELYDGLLRHIAESHYGGDLRRLMEVGVFSADKALHSTYEAYVQKELESFLRLLGALHGRFYSAGELTVVDIDPAAGHCHLRLHGAPYYTEPDMYVAQGFYIGAARVMGSTGVECDFTIDDGQKDSGGESGEEGTSSEANFKLRWHVAEDEAA